MADQASEQARELGERATETASRARHQAAAALDQAEDVIEERTGLISTIRQNPLPALGIAFGLGFMLAGSESGQRQRGRKRGGGMQKTMDQAKTAVISAISTVAAQQVRSLLAGMTGEQGGSSGQGAATAGTGPARH